MTFEKPKVRKWKKRVRLKNENKKRCDLASLRDFQSEKKS
jgi:hypothetical protein